MRIRTDMVGQRFGRWIVLAFHAQISKRDHWHAVCDCGAQKIVNGANMRRGKSKSCGCDDRNGIGNRTRTHDRSRSPEYWIWNAMKNRCLNPNDKDWKHYGGRGITVCAEWQNSFEAFLADMGSKPQGGSIERVDVNGNYEPSNCVWIPLIKQARNRRDSEYLEANGKRMLIIEWSEFLGISTMTLRTRLSRGWSPERAVSEPVLPRWHPDRRKMEPFPSDKK